jgi:hypothetical protein
MVPVAVQRSPSWSAKSTWVTSAGIVTGIEWTRISKPKSRLGWDHFLVRGFEKVCGEIALMVRGYHLTPVINTLGLQPFRDYCAQRLTGGRMAVQAAVAA